VFEVRQRISETPLTTCEACGGSVRRLLSAAPFILKGEGWYVTDYPSEARKKAMQSEKPAAKSDGAKPDGAKADAAKADGAKSDGGSPSTSATASGASSPPASKPD
jgi:putative FmdB family regulatory protein